MDSKDKMDARLGRAEEATDRLAEIHEGKREKEVEIPEMGYGNHGGTCAICLDKIVLQETAIVKGCEHAYCVTCILRWASITKKPTCPQCKHPFEFLNVHRSIDGSIHDYALEESVCLLLRAAWFQPVIVEEEIYDDFEDDYSCEDDADDFEEAYLSASSSLRIGNRRWGETGYMRTGRLEARPIFKSKNQEFVASTSSQLENKDDLKDKTGRKAKKALKQEAADKAAAAKHQKHLARFGRK